MNPAVQSGAGLGAVEQAGAPEVAELNLSIPRFYCYLRSEFLYDLESHHGELTEVCVLGVASIHGRALGFHVLTSNGAVMWRLPIHALCHKRTAQAQPLDWLQFWDCFSYNITVTLFDRLRDARVRVQLRDRSWEGGQYMFTFDWIGSEDSEEAGDGGSKCAHLIALDNGNFALQPNNRVQWLDPAFVTPFQEKPTYLTNTHVWKVERETETSQAYFYESTVDQNSQTSLYAKGLRTEERNK